jgi:hypothetical protein
VSEIDNDLYAGSALPANPVILELTVRWHPERGRWQADALWSDTYRQTLDVPCGFRLEQLPDHLLGARLTGTPSGEN